MTVQFWRSLGPRLLPPRLRFQRARQRRNPRLVVGQAVLRMNACHDPAGFSVTPTRRPSTKISTHAYHRGRKRGKHSIAEIENDILIIFDRARRMQYDITKYSLEPHQYAREPHCRTPTCSRRTTKTVAIQCDVFLSTTLLCQSWQTLFGYQMSSMCGPITGFCMTAHPRYSWHRHRAGLYSVCLDRSTLPSQVVLCQRRLFLPDAVWRASWAWSTTP